ncbi:MAG TPA: hypothetical protein VN796_05385 [Acidimicrobiales bacterium]|nr:hypothetical protein [Acidimicrobiales bacterium]
MAFKDPGGRGTSAVTSLICILIILWSVGLLWRTTDLFVGQSKLHPGHDAVGATLANIVSLILLVFLGFCILKIARHATTTGELGTQLAWVLGPLLLLVSALTLLFTANYYDAERHCYVIDNGAAMATVTMTPVTRTTTRQCPSSRLGAFYFTVANLSTIGAPDVEAVGEPGRILLVGQMLTDLFVFLTFGVLVVELVEISKKL